MSKQIITISREFGSGGRSVGHRVAELLGVPYYDKELVKQVRQEAETARISLRNARRDAVEAFKKAVKEGMPEDESKDGENQVQKLLEKFSKLLDAQIDKKEKEIMTV